VTTPRGNVDALLQEIGLPAVEVKAGSAEVIDFNELFSSLFNAGAPLEQRLWFRDGVLSRLKAADRTRWESAFANQDPLQVHISFSSVDGPEADFEMRSFPSFDGKRLAQTILCIFIPLNGPILQGIFDAHVSLGRELEKGRIRSELHKDVSQKLLGAAFGCKLLAGKAAKLSTSLGKEASDLAELVNEAVVELQNLVQSSQN
jgi:hypothetical protein